MVVGVPDFGSKRIVSAYPSIRALFFRPVSTSAIFKTIGAVILLDSHYNYRVSICLLTRARPKDAMKLKYSLPAVCLTMVLAGCGSVTPEAVETPDPESSIATAMGEATKLAADWKELDSLEYELPDKGTEHFSKEQVDKVASDVVHLLESQLEYQQAESQEEVLGDVDKFTSSAPGKLASLMADTSKEDANDKDNIIWPLSYVQPIDSSYEIGDASRFTYAWDVKEQDMFDTDGVEVTLFHRSLYKVQNTDDEENFLVVGRWLGLSTVDPDYAAESGDYAWRQDFSARGAEVCDAVNRSLLVPSTDKAEDSDLDNLMKVKASAFAPRSEFKEDEKDFEKEAAKC